MRSLKKIILRSDGTTTSGLGHLCRLVALGNIFEDEYEIVFLTKITTINKVIPEKFNKTIIPDDISLNNEPEWISKNYNHNEFIIIIDGYQFSSNYQKRVKKFGFKLVYIDDLSTEKMYADIVVNHSIGLTINDFTSVKATKFALGPSYAVLRQEFIYAAKKSRKIKSIEEVFICFGGSDLYDLSNRSLEGLIKLKQIKKIHVVLGAGYNYNKIYRTSQKRKNSVFIYNNICEKEIITLMNSCQLAIVPSSTISYEACSVKMIILSGYYTDNQININKGLDQNGLIYNVGNFKTLKSSDINEKVKKIIDDDPTNYDKFIKKQTSMFDGHQKIRYKNLLKSL